MKIGRLKSQRTCQVSCSRERGLPRVNCAHHPQKSSTCLVGAGGPQKQVALPAPPLAALGLASPRAIVDNCTMATTVTAQEVARRLGIPFENLCVVQAEDTDEERKEPLACAYTRSSFYQRVKAHDRGNSDCFPSATLLKENSFEWTMQVAYATFNDVRVLYDVLRCNSLQMVPLCGAMQGFAAWLDEEGKITGAKRNKQAEALIGDMIHGTIHGPVLVTRLKFDPASADFAKRFAFKTKVEGLWYGLPSHRNWIRKMCVKHDRVFDEHSYELHQELEELEMDEQFAEAEAEANAAEQRVGSAQLDHIMHIDFE